MTVYFSRHFTRTVEETNTWMGYFGKALSPSNYLPSQVNDVIEIGLRHEDDGRHCVMIFLRQVAEVFSQGRAFANVKLPTAGLKNVCAIAT